MKVKGVIISGLFTGAIALIYQVTVKTFLPDIPIRSLGSFLIYMASFFITNSILRSNSYWGAFKISSLLTLIAMIGIQSYWCLRNSWYEWGEIIPANLIMLSIHLVIALLTSIRFRNKKVKQQNRLDNILDQD